MSIPPPPQTKKRDVDPTTTMLANFAPALGERLVFAGIHPLVYQIGCQTKTRRRASVGLMLGRRLQH